MGAWSYVSINKDTLGRVSYVKLALIGFGNAGGKVVDRILAKDRDVGGSLCQSVLAINSAETDLHKPELIPEDKRMLIGQADPRVKGHGVGADPELGAEVARKDIYEAMRAMDDVPVHAIDAFLVVGGFGGGTGSGGGPIVAQALRDTYDEPVYGLGILPSTEEGGRASLNAARVLPNWVDATDNLLMFDNDVWRGADDSIGGGYDRTNDELAERIYSLLAAGSTDGSMISENAMDASDIRRTLGTQGISTIAYASAPIEESTRRNRGFLSSFRSNGSDSDTDATKKITGLVRQAVQSRLTLPAEVNSAQRSLVVITGPPEECSRKGLDAARQWLEQQTGSVEVLGGDKPRPNAETISATVVLANVTDVPRIENLKAQGVDAQQNIADKAEFRDSELHELAHTSDLEPV